MPEDAAFGGFDRVGDRFGEITYGEIGAGGSLSSSIERPLVNLDSARSLARTFLSPAREIALSEPVVQKVNAAGLLSQRPAAAAPCTSVWKPKCCENVIELVIPPETHSGYTQCARVRAPRGRRQRQVDRQRIIILPPKTSTVRVSKMYAPLPSARRSCRYG
jgi:hypothetical protein